METVIPAVIGIITVVVGALVAAKATRKTESRKQAGQLAAEALIDLVRALSSNSEARKILGGFSSDPLLHDLSPTERAYFVQVLAESRITFISSKARLVSFGTLPVASSAATAFAEDFSGTSAKDQRSLCELVHQIREDMHPSEPRLSDEQVITLLFGHGAAALGGSENHPSTVSE